MALRLFATTNSRTTTVIDQSAQVVVPNSGRLDTLIPFSHYLWLIQKQWFKIVSLIMFCSLGAYIIASQITPIYESTVRLTIDPRTSSTVIGDLSNSTPSGSEADQVFNTQLQIIQSDAVLRPVAERFHLLASVTSRKLPLGMTVADAPIYLPGLLLVHPPNSFLINISYRSKHSVEAAAVANAIAHSYISRQIEMRVHSSMEESSFMQTQIAELKARMDSSANALAGYERQLGVVNPEERTSILAARLMQLNTEYTESQNERIHREADFTAFQSGSLAAVQVSPEATALSKIEDNIRTAEQKLSTARLIYGSNNTEYKKSANDLAEINRQYSGMKTDVGKRIEVEYKKALTREHLLNLSLLQTKNEMDALNAHSLKYQELKREAEANKTLYSELFRKVNEASINSAFQGSAIRIADEARPQISPSFPNKSAFVFVGFLFSVGTCLILVIITDVLDNTLKDPVQIKRDLQLDVLGVLPCLGSSKHLLPNASVEITSSRGLLSSTKWFSTKEFYQEAIDLLLGSVFSNPHQQPLYSVLITSANPGEGKSTCVAHMAAAYARQGFKTLLIDADLRSPSQQQLFKLSSSPGLAEAIFNEASLHDLCQQIEGNENLCVVTAGKSRQRVYNQVSKTVNRLLLEGRYKYDVVLIDGPPMLCFAEPLQLAALVDGVLIVNHAGVTSLDIVSDLLSTLRRIRANQLGIVLNRVKYNMSATYKPYHRYYRALVNNT